MARVLSFVRSNIAFMLLLTIVIAFAVVLVSASAEEAAAEQQPPPESANAPTRPAADPVVEDLPDEPTLLKMKVRELKAILAKKGPTAECLACTSKREYVDRIHETKDWPTIEHKPDPTPDADTPSMDELRAMFNKGRDDDEMKDIKKKLKEAGIDTSNIFTGADFDSEAFARQFKKWDKAGDAASTGAGAGAGAGEGADAGAKDDSHVEL